MSPFDIKRIAMGLNSGNLSGRKSPSHSGRNEYSGTTLTDEWRNYLDRSRYSEKRRALIRQIHAKRPPLYPEPNIPVNVPKRVLVEGDVRNVISYFNGLDFFSYIRSFGSVGNIESYIKLASYGFFVVGAFEVRGVPQRGARLSSSLLIVGEPSIIRKLKKAFNARKNMYSLTLYDSDDESLNEIMIQNNLEKLPLNPSLKYEGIEVEDPVDRRSLTDPDGIIAEILAIVQ
jgi:hypothetical protein